MTMPYINARDVAAIEHEPGLFAAKLIDGSRGARDIALLRGWLEPGASHAAHTHDVEEAVVFLSGHGTVSVEGQQFAVGPGDAVLIPAGAVHSTTNLDADETLHFVASFPDSVVCSRAAFGEAQHRGTRMIRRRGSSFWNQIRWMWRRMLPRLRAGGQPA